MQRAPGCVFLFAHRLPPSPTVRQGAPGAGTLGSRACFPKSAASAVVFAHLQPMWLEAWAQAPPMMEQQACHGQEESPHLSPRLGRLPH